ncbi:MAG: DNA gyrase inhibitor YacG [Beijerinckiaceae bacterium]|jgi:uncharacterized protein|nr:DNA gyrase inhibitor YacG [Beijerinckiaceae bacterium]
MSVANDNEHPEEPLVACPICRKMATEAYRPFCSKRCADVDLARWLGGTYAIPAAPIDDEDEEELPGRASRPSIEE